jgi:hypothetical protein
MSLLNPVEQPFSQRVAMPDTTPNSLVKDLVDGSGNPKPYVVFTGYLWKASDKDTTVRLYTDLDFHSYYEIQIADILHTTRPDLQHEEVPAKVYVAAAANVSLVQRGTAVTVKPGGQTVPGEGAAYLKGGISSAHLGDALRTIADCLCDVVGSVVHCVNTTGPACSSHPCIGAAASPGGGKVRASILSCVTTLGVVCSLNLSHCKPECSPKCEKDK